MKYKYKKLAISQPAFEGLRIIVYSQFPSQIIKNKFVHYDQLFI